MDSQSSVEFDAIGQLLTAAGALWDAAEAHGAFCGWACLGGAAAIPAWSAALLEDAREQDVLAGERRQHLFKLAADALLQMERGDMGFAPLLPGDDAALTDRTASLAEWCEGFMHGLAVGGETDATPAHEALTTGVVAEILEDFSEITRAAVGEEPEEISEQAYAELVEFVRVSAQLVYDETAGLRKPAKDN